MTEISSLQDLYKYIEEHALDFNEAYAISGFIQSFLDKLKKDNNPTEIKKTEWEILAFSFNYNEGLLTPTFIGKNEKGEEVRIPDIDQIGEDIFTYYDERLNETKNIFLRAYYSQLLWSSPFKHKKYAIIAVDSYLELIDNFNEKISKLPSDNYERRVVSFCENALVIALKSQHRDKDVISVVTQILENFDYKKYTSFYVRHNLLELLLKQKKKISKDFFKGVADICLNEANALISKCRYEDSIRMFELGEEIDKKTEQTSHQWVKSKAESYERLTNRRINTPMVAMSYCLEALKYYKVLKDVSKIRKMEKLFDDLKRKQDFSKIKVDIDSDEQSKHVEKWALIAQDIVQKGTQKIVSFLSGCKDLLPSYAEVDKQSDEDMINYPMQSLMPVSVVDQFGNVVEVISSDSGKKYFRILQVYQFYLEMDYFHRIGQVFDAWIRYDGFSVDDLLTFLREKSWLGTNISQKMADGNDYVYNHLDLLTPSIRDYFGQLLKIKNGNKDAVNFILCIDSMSLKLEGIIRDLCRMSGGVTFFETKDKQNNNSVTREKDINALLHEENVKKIINEDDCLFLKFLMVEKAGYNLRHKVAHSLMFVESYGFPYATLLIQALLRLSKYQIVISEEN